MKRCARRRDFLAMKILPSSTRLPSAPLRRRHHPTDVATYQRHKACLRWDFGFTCAFCLLHEADFSPLPESRTGMMSAEHVIPKNVDESKLGSYTNIVYCCRLCNRARGVHPHLSKNDEKLLDPTATAWSSHFELDRDAIIPKANDQHARYTAKAYGLDDRDKTTVRRMRRELFERNCEYLDAFTENERRLLDKAKNAPNIERLALMDAARKLAKLAANAMADLRRFRAIPIDAPTSCRCRPTPSFTLPEFYQDQLIDIPEK